MNSIVVLTTLTQGNETVGHTETIAKILNPELRLWQVYEKMKKEGNGDIVIPRRQE